MTDIEQIGSTLIVAKDIIWDGQSVKASQQSHGHQIWYTRQIDPFLELPNSGGEPWPAGGLSLRSLPLTSQYPSDSEHLYDFYFRNYAATSRFRLRNFAGSQDLFIMDDDGTWSFNGSFGSATLELDAGADSGLRINATTYGRIRFKNSTEPADEKSWQILQAPGLLAFQTLNDAEDASSTWMQVNRGTGNTVASLTFPSGGGIVFGAPTGGAMGAGTLNVAGGIYKNGVAYVGDVQGAAALTTPGRLARTTAGGTIGDSAGLSEHDEGAGIINLRATASTYAKFSFENTGADPDEGKWQFYAHSAGLVLGTLNGAEDEGVVVMDVTRGAGTSVTLVNFPAPVGAASAQIGGTEIVSAARVLHNVTADAGIITSGTVALARGGTAADLSATGGATKILAQDAAHAISARDLVAADIPNLVDVRYRRGYGTTGTATQNSDYGLSGWGSGASVAVLAGSYDGQGTFTVTCGTSPTSNPTITLTFADGAWDSAPFALAVQNGGTGLVAWIAAYDVGTTYVRFQYIGTPAAGFTYRITYMLRG